jgi:hypothetical protein
VYIILSGNRPNRVSIEESASSPEESGPAPIEISEIQELFQWTSEIITTLFRLSVVIRNATTRDRYAKAVGSYPAFKDMLKVDLTHVKSKFPRIGNDEDMEWLVYRLGHAITLRRQFLYYQRRHRNAAELQPSTGNDSKEQGRGDQSFEQTPSETYKDLFKLTESRGPAPTTASTLDAAKADQQVAAGLELQDESDGMSSHATSIAVGDGDARRIIIPLGDIETKDRHFECPYCRDIQYIRTDHAWRQVWSC